MGFFDIFKKSKNKEIEEIKDLDLWFSKLSKEVFSEINEEFDLLKEEIVKEKENMRKNIQKLKEIKLEDKNFVARIKSAVEGNKKAYSYKLTMFLDEIVLPENLSDVLSFCGFCDKKLSEFSKTTMRNYIILKEFFKERVKDLASNLKSLDTLIKKLRKLVESPEYGRINEIQIHITNYKNKINKKKSLEGSKNLLKKDIKQIKNNLEKKSKNLKEKEESKEHTNYKEKEKELSKVKLDLKTINHKRFSYFSVIEVALRKFERLIKDKKIVKSYLEDSLKALLDDKELKIVDVLIRMKALLINNKIDIKSSKKQKILKELDKLDKSYLLGFRKKYQGLNGKLNDLKIEISKDFILEDILKLKKGVDNFNNELNEKKAKLKELLEDFNKIDLDSLKVNLENELNSNLDYEVKLIF